MVDSTEAGDPTNTGVQSKGDVKTAVLDNLASKPSGGDDSTTPPKPATDVTGQPPGDVQPPDDSGTADRLKQQLAQSNQLLAALNIDPDSDLGERYARGLVSKEELLLRVSPAPQPTAPPMPQVPVVPRQKLDNLKQRLSQSVKENKGILETDILEILDAVSDVNRENDQLRENNDMENHFKDCRNATLAVIEKDELHNKLPEDIKEIESQVFLSSTDNLLSTFVGNNPKGYTVKNYDYYADRNLRERISTYRNYWIEQGKLQQQQATTKGNAPQVNPISPTTGSAPVTPPETKTTIDNVDARAKAYTENWGTV